MTSATTAFAGVLEKVREMRASSLPPPTIKRVSADRTVVDRERTFGIDELFFSATDSRGFIRSANNVFGRVAGYRPDEYLNRPHNVVRHPDMPRAVFRLLWTFLQRGEPIAAYVKNRAKDGGYYWVLALAYPAGDEYISIRLKPSSELFPVVEKLYKELLALERRVEANAETVAAGRNAAMDASEAALAAALAELGFEDYPSFMRRALAAEVASRRALIDGTSGANRQTIAGPPVADAWRATGERSIGATLQVCAGTSRHLDLLAVRLDRFEKLAAEFAASTEFFSDLAEDVGLFALNAGLTADRVRSKAVVLRSVAELMQVGARGVERDVADLGGSLSAATGHVRRLAFSVAGAALAVEMVTSFLTVVAAEGGHTTDGGHSRVGADTSGLLVSLTSDLAALDAALGGLDALLAQLLPPLRLLESHIAQLRILRIRAEVEAAEDDSARQFVTIIAEVEGQLASGLERCRHLAMLVDEARADAQRIDRKVLRTDHARLQEIRTALLRA